METTYDFIEYRVDARKNLLYGRWLRDVTNEEYQQGLQYMHSLMTMHNITLWLQNSTLLLPRSIEDFRWVTEEFALLLIRSEIKKLAIVTPRESAHYNGLTMMRDRAYRIFGKTKEVEIFDTDQQALRWLIPNMQHYRLPETSITL